MWMMETIIRDSPNIMKLAGSLGVQKEFILQIYKVSIFITID
jgi:hypothetical protein